LKDIFEELKFEWPHRKILAGSSSKTPPKIASEWKGENIWFGLLDPLL